MLQATSGAFDAIFGSGLTPAPTQPRFNSLSQARDLLGLFSIDYPQAVTK
jgi:hypothetical protein